MPQGLQVWNASGQLIVDHTSNIGKVLGVAQIAAGVAGNVVDARFALGTPFWSFVPKAGSLSGAWPVITYNAGLTRLEWSNSAAVAHYIVYGVL